MNAEDITRGLRVKVHTLGSTAGMLIAEKNLVVRREGAIGTIEGYVAGHGGDVWWVRHEDPPYDAGAYSFTEFAPYEGAAPEESKPVSIFD